MPNLAAHRPRTTAFKAWVWLLLCAVLLQGGAGALVQVLGRAHTHLAVQPAPAPGWLDGILAWRQARLQALQSTGLFRHAAVAAADHHHGGLERHHHSRGDATVQAVDGASSDATLDSGQGGAGSTAPAWGPTAGARTDVRAAAGAAGAAWLVAAQPAWTSAPNRLPERPPRA
jgi:hypothetical protein